jgi:hypothetical protein
MRQKHLAGLEAGKDFHSRFDVAAEVQEEVVILAEGLWKHAEGQDDGAVERSQARGFRNYSFASLQITEAD